MRNFSSSGARIEFENAAILPDEVDLTIERKGLAFLARIIWRRENDIGFAFRNPKHLNATVSLDWALSMRASERTNKALQIKAISFARVIEGQPLTFMFRSTMQAPPARRMRLQRSSAELRVSVPIRTW